MISPNLGAVWVTLVQADDSFKTGSGRSGAIKIERIGEKRDELGECPTWDPVDGVLSFVDSSAHAIFRYDPRSGDIKRWDVAGVNLAPYPCAPDQAEPEDLRRHQHHMRRQGASATSVPARGVAPESFTMRPHHRVARRGGRI